VIVTAGVPRKPGMSRDDLLTINLRIMRGVAGNVKQHAPNAFVIVISNPLDAMVYEMKKVTGFARSHVVGMAGALDSARFQAFLAEELQCSVKDVSALVLGGHGDTMVPCLTYTTVKGIPVGQLCSKEKLAAMIERTAKGGGELVNLLGTSAWYAPGAAAAQMVDAIALDEKRVLPVTAYLEGEYGIDGLYMGVPVRLGAAGVEEIVKLRLSTAEKKMLRESAAAVREVVGVLTTG
jgi:malate dehydrogenase